MRLFQIFVIAEPMSLQNILDSSIEALDHAIGLWTCWRSQAMLDAKVSADAVEIVAVGRPSAAMPEQTIREFFAVIRERAGDTFLLPALPMFSTMSSGHDAS